MAVLMTGGGLAGEITKKVAEGAAAFAAASGRPPMLAVIMGGSDEGSKVYVRRKELACKDAGIRFCSVTLREDFPTRAYQQVASVWSGNQEIDGILVQLPLPPRADRLAVLNAVPPEKDVDGFHAANLGALVQGDPRFVPCTPLAVARLLDHYGVQTRGKRVAVVNRSIVVGQPLAAILGSEPRDATVTVCHVATPKDTLKSILRDSDIIVVAVGRRPDFCLTADMVKPGAAVVDVGFNRDNGKVVGDADFEEVSRVAGHITPVPGGVGPVTVAVLLENTLKAAVQRHGTRKM